MRARDLAQPYPFVTTDDSAVDAAKMVAKLSLPALLVLDPQGHPQAVVPGTQLVRQLVPFCFVEDPLLAAVDDGRDDTEHVKRLAGHTVAEWAPRHLYPPPVVGPEAPPIKVAVLMAHSRVPLVAVVDTDGNNSILLGVVTAARLLHYFTTASPQGVRQPLQPRPG
ncbi:CBS domain-containing protein [Kribbella swartbergensis]